jgi:cobalamin synthase
LTILIGGAVVERGFGGYLARSADSMMVTTAVAGSLLVRAELLTAIGSAHWLWAFPATLVIGRWAAMFLQAIGDPILDQTHGQPPRSLVAAAIPAWAAVAATAAVSVSSVVVLGWSMLVAMGIAAALAFAIGLAAQRSRGGIDAAVVGAAAMAGELATLLVLAAA